MRHEDLTKNHITERWVYANAAARTGASGFVAGDVGKLSFQSDTFQYWRLTSTAPTWIPFDPAAINVQGVPSDPVLTASTAFVMMGCALAFTPLTTGKILIFVTGTISNSVLSDGATAQIRHGTGAAPVNGAAVTGTGDGKAIRMINNASTAALRLPFALTSLVTGLTLGTAIWIDIALAAITAGNANVYDLCIDVVEL
jgi:hypothetical protein